MKLPLQCGISVDDVDGVKKLTDHNRAAISVDWTKIENKQRMANGTLRKFVVSEKRKFKVSWTNLPNKDSVTVDGYWGADSIEAFYKRAAGAFWITLNYGDGTNDRVQVMFDSFSSKVNKRGKYTDLYDLDFGLEEV